MCGICGILAPRGSRVDPDLVDRMIRTVGHRGPDAFGIYAKDHLGFGHARLSIIDLAGGSQPMQTADGAFTITFNGEIFNYQELKQELIIKKEATDLFANERQANSIEGIVGNVFQSFGGKNVYETIEEKAAHLLYFIVKNHPFSDGNKRSGAFAFVWFLRKAKILNISRITPEALTALTLLVAESDPKDMGQVVGLVIMLLGK